MLPPEGSVKDGRTIVYLERIAPSGGMQDGGAGKKSSGAAKDGGKSGGDGVAAPAGPDFAKGKKAGTDAPEAPNKKGGAKTPRAKPSVKELLPSSKEAAAANQAASMVAAAESGAPFCEDCAEAHRLLEEASRTA